MPTSFTRTETCLDTKTTVTTETVDNKVTTTTQTDNQTTTSTTSGGDTVNTALLRCPCHRLDLPKLLEETRRQAFRSTNRSAASANAVLIFAQKVLQQVLIFKCRQDEVDINQIFLIAGAIAEIAQNIRVYNPAPFNS